MAHAVTVIKIGVNVIGFALKAGSLIKDSTNTKLDEVFDQICNVDKTIRDLHDEILQAAYAMPCERIQNGAKYLKLIVGGHKVKYYQKKIKDICANDNMTSQLNALVNGIIGGRKFPGRVSILKMMYEHTNGHLSKLEEFCTGLLALLVGGCSVIYYYETIEQGEENAKDFLEQNFSKQIDRAKKSIDDILERCKTEMKENLQRDIKSYVDAHKDDKVKQKFVDEFYDKVKSKYGWLDLVVLSFKTAPTRSTDTGNVVRYFDPRHGKGLNVLYADKDREKEFPHQVVLDAEGESADEAIKYAISRISKSTTGGGILDYMKHQRIPCLCISEREYATRFPEWYLKTELTQEMGFFSCAQTIDGLPLVGGSIRTNYTTFFILE